MMHQVSIFFHKRNRRAFEWDKKIRKWLKVNFPSVNVTGGNPASARPKPARRPDVVIALGGDGTILEAARKYHELGAIILGLNLGNVGFLASARDEKYFLKALENFFKGKYSIIERMMLTAEVKRKGKTVFVAEALNEIAIKNLLGMVELQARVENHPVKYIRGTGILVATATGSTAYNLSAHGPIVMPDIKCLIITEMFDHSIPSPSMVVKHDNAVSIKVVSYRERGLISMSKTRQKAEVIMIADGESIFPLERGDIVSVKSSPHLVKFAELEKNYFFKSLQEKFGFE